MLVVMRVGENSASCWVAEELEVTNAGALL